MIEYQREEQIEMLQARGFLVKVIGVGGAGSNVLDQIALDGMEDAELICMNTDVRTLKTSTAHSKVQIGKQLTRGLGAGGDPELGILAAEEAESEIRAALRGQNMVFICTGLGGGTGSGAAPTVSRIAKEEGAFVVVFATMPFSFEGRRRIQQAETSLKLLERSADALITFENDRMGELVLPKEGIQQAFGNADKIISQSVRAITNVVTQPGLIQIGMDDLLTALKNPVSRCLFGYGAAKGKNRAAEALKIAMRSPLLDRGKLLEKSRNALVHVVGGSSMSLYEVELLMNEMSKNVGNETQILFGAATDEKMEDNLSVTIISSLTLEELRQHDSIASELQAGDTARLASSAEESSRREEPSSLTATVPMPTAPSTTIKEETPPNEEVEELLEEPPSETVEPVQETDEALTEESETGEQVDAEEVKAEEERRLAAVKSARKKVEAEEAEVKSQEAEAVAGDGADDSEEAMARREAEEEKARQEAFRRRREELRKSQGKFKHETKEEEAPSQEAPTEDPEPSEEAQPEEAKPRSVVAEKPSKPAEPAGKSGRPTAEDLMAQRRKAQEELERKRAELEKLLKLEDEARRKRPTTSAKAAAPTPAMAPTVPSISDPIDDLSGEPELELPAEGSDMDQTQRVPVQPRQSPPGTPARKPAPQPPAAKPLAERPGAPGSASTAKSPSSGNGSTTERRKSASQGELELEPLRGRFEKSSPTVMDGENLDVPTFFRKRGKKG